MWIEALAVKISGLAIRIQDWGGALALRSKFASLFEMFIQQAPLGGPTCLASEYRHCTGRTKTQWDKKPCRGLVKTTQRTKCTSPVALSLSSKNNPTRKTRTNQHHPTPTQRRMESSRGSRHLTRQRRARGKGGAAAGEEAEKGGL